MEKEKTFEEKIMIVVNIMYESLWEQFKNDDTKTKIDALIFLKKWIEKAIDDYNESLWLTLKNE